MLNGHSYIRVSSENRPDLSEPQRAIAGITLGVYKVYESNLYKRIGRGIKV